MGIAGEMKFLERKGFDNKCIYSHFYDFCENNAIFLSEPDKP